MFKLDQLLKDHVPAGGCVMHIGGDGSELPTYQAAGFKTIIFVEAHPDVFARLATLASTQVKVFHAAACGQDGGELPFHTMSNDQCGSLLAPWLVLNHYPTIIPGKKISVPSRTVDSIARELGVHLDFLNVDVQGAEGLVLDGAQEELKHVRAILLELNLAELYEGCQLEAQIIARLPAFELFAATEANEGWHDGFFVRK